MPDPPPQKPFFIDTANERRGQVQIVRGPAAFTSYRQNRNSEGRLERIVLQVRLNEEVAGSAATQPVAPEQPLAPKAAALEHPARAHVRLERRRLDAHKTCLGMGPFGEQAAHIRRDA